LAFVMVFWVAFMHHCGRADAVSVGRGNPEIQ
jgi:hypothetical protein